jgi:hypothetical protein
MQGKEVIISPKMFSAPKVMMVEHGMTLRQIANQMYNASDIPPSCRTYDLIIEVDGEPIGRDRWDIVPDVKSHVLINVPVHGNGKSPLRTILSIVVVVIATFATWYLGGAGGAAAAGWMGAGALGSYSALAGVAISTAGMMLVNAIAPIRPGDLSAASSQYSDSPTYSLSGASNVSNPFGPIPVVLGIHKQYPPYGANPYTEILGNDEYLRMLFIWGYGPLKIENIKIGETLLSSDGNTVDGQYDDVEIETVEGRDGDPDLTLIPNIVYQDQIGVELIQADGRLIRTARPNVDELSIDIVCPQGLALIDDNGARVNFTVMVLAEYREVGTSEWTPLTIVNNVGINAQSMHMAGLSDGTYSFYAHKTGYITRAAGTAEQTDYYRIAEAVIETQDYGDLQKQVITSLTDLAPAGTTGLETTLVGDLSVLFAAGTVEGYVCTIKASGSTYSALRYGYRWTVDRTKQYEVAMSRVTADQGSTTIVDTVYWSVLRSFINDPPVTYPFPLAMTAVRIRASGQLQGIIDNLSATVSSYAPVWDGSQWTGEAVTQNPAALYRLVLMHPANARPRSATQINDAVLGDWNDSCVTNGYKFNMIRDYRSSIWDVLADIATAGRAAPSLNDGTWGAISDTGTQAVVQHITPRNSWGFSAEKTFYDKPHAFRVQFVDEDNDYKTNERIVYDDGYDSSNATLFESIEFPGVTDPDLIWKFGRYHIAQARLRPETYSVYQDFEHLVCRRGSKVRVAHDVVLWGSGWGRVKSLIIDEGDATKTAGVVLDDKVVMTSGVSYGCRFRLADADNTSLALSVVTAPGETDTLTFQTLIPTTEGPQAGDMAMFGETDQETAECLVKGIERASDFTARLILVDVAADIYTADTGAIPEFDSNITQPMDVTKAAPGAPSIIGIQSGTTALEILNGAIRPRILVSLYPAGGSLRISKYRVRYRELCTSIWSFSETQAENLTAIISDVTQNLVYEIQAQAISIYGVESAWSTLRTETVIGESEVPANVTGFACNIVGNQAHLSWDPNTEIDLDYYRIKQSPEKTGALWSAAVDAVDRVGKPSTSITLPAIVGSYLIKAVDYQGNESVTAAVAITSIARVANLNFVEAMEQPDWDGTGDGVAYIEDLGGLILESANDLYDAVDLYEIPELYVNESLLAEGTYEIADVIDLQDIFTVRATAALTITGTDLLSDLYSFADLYSAVNLYGVGEGQYSVSLEIRTTQDDPDSAPTWTEYQRFIVGDYSARAFQFRLKLTGTPPGITPIVQAVRVSLDMEDRVVSFTATVPVAGYRVVFDPAFYVAPEVGLSVIDGQEGDNYTITNKDETGFDIAFTNAGVAVERTISGIAKAYGYREAA